MVAVVETVTARWRQHTERCDGMAPYLIPGLSSHSLLPSVIESVKIDDAHAIFWVATILTIVPVRVAIKHLIPGPRFRSGIMCRF